MNEEQFVMTELEVLYPEGWVIHSQTELDYIKIKKCDLDEIVMNAARYLHFMKECEWRRGDKDTRLCLRIEGTPDCSCHACRENEFNKQIDEMEIKTYLHMETILVRKSKSTAV